MSDVIGILENIGSNASLNVEVTNDSLVLLRKQNLNQHTCSVLLSKNASQIGLLTGARAKIRCFIALSGMPEESYLLMLNGNSCLGVLPDKISCREVA